MQNINKFTEVYIFVPSITIRRKLPYMESRVKEIDYLKCIFITLMIIFHLVYIGDKYPYAKQIVYTFHMSAFLIISGYLANNRKDARSFLRKFLWIFIPYACMEAAYTVMSHFLPVRESVDAITPTVLLDKIFLQSEQARHDIQTGYTDSVFSVKAEQIIDEEDYSPRNRLICHALKTLSSKQQEILYLYYIRDLSHEEIAELLNINYQSSKNLLFRSITKLREMLLPTEDVRE